MSGECLPVRAACIELIRRIDPKDSISYEQAVVDLRELTGVADITRVQIMEPMNQASKDLRELGEPGLRNRTRFGWIRETVDEMVLAGEKHERKANRQMRWSIGAVLNINIELLSPTSRARRDGLLYRDWRSSELERRRALRRRPLPSGEDETG